jgi:antitoxin component of RelBE/YafQ-DinJ toxin-antitoxin module
MNQTTIEFSIPDEIYEQAKEICESNGLTLEEACVRFLEATVACGDLPFPYTQQDIEEAKKLGVTML